ncbi:hypothetical protein M413DRAFT_427873 [Hebeloma cylindrosporum]|uniref:SAM domain-containing protein n=1 Tax=Hebeloma cylindrosporum TaxID=76867 RepID=A0A0C2Y4R4_HEBCY|nr:hypothetical protein M413DRAFT_32562 [Hebeloma cylindrosporum h7]KIM36042.1 hypothetical protein M413DRAFT_427873 [Hebeloma cylindrosporum h7]
MSRLTVRKNARRTPSNKTKENLINPAAVAQSRPRPKPRPTGKGAKVSQDSTVLANASNNDQEVRGVAETLVSMRSHALPEEPIDKYCRAMFNIPPGVPLVTTSDIEDNEEENDDDIDQLDSDDDEDISNGDLLLPVESPSRSSKPHASTSSFDIPIEVPYKNAKRDVSGITSASSFAHVLRQIAARMDAGPSRMAAIGYIPSFLPKSPKPVPKLLEDEECWEKLIRDVREYIESFTVKRGPPKRIKPFVITIVDTIASSDNNATPASSAKKKKNIDEAPSAALTGRESAQMEKVHLLEKRHHCQQHKKSCVIQDDGSHYHLTTNDLAKWALLMVDGDALAGVPPDKLDLPKIAKRQEAAKRAAAKTVKAESPDHSQPPQWIQQMLGVMLMRDMARGPALTPQSMHTSSEIGITSNASAALVNEPVTPAKRPASPLITTDIPSLQDWFKTLDTIPGRKSSNALDFIPILEANDIEDLADLVSFNAQELMDLTKMTIGLAKRLLRYAEEDLASIRSPKRQRLN